MNYIISTLGCKVNQYETQAVEEILRQRGHAPATESSPDVVIVNTCAVTAESGRKCRQTIRALKAKYPNALLAVCGCYSQISPESVKKIGADVIYGSGNRISFVDDIEEAYISQSSIVKIDQPFDRSVFEELPAGSYSGRTRAMIKVQDGCTNFCSYCIIPYARGSLRSLPIENAVSQALQLKSKGYREIVITGIEISSYGIDLPGNDDLTDLIVSVADSVPQLRIRLGSLEPTIISDMFCHELSKRSNICPHFHLSLQSGCNRTLIAMNRKYSSEEYYGKVQKLRKYFPGCAITTDIIVGFPDETEYDFQTTLDFLEKCCFSQVHVFPYSRREGTVADKMKNQISSAVKKERVHKAMEITNKTRMNYLENNIGKVLPVLFETKTGTKWEGHSDTYLHVMAEGENLRGLVKNVKIIQRVGENLVGVIL